MSVQYDIRSLEECRDGLKAIGSEIRVTSESFNGQADFQGFETAVALKEAVGVFEAAARQQFTRCAEYVESASNAVEQVRKGASGNDQALAELIKP